MSAPANENDWHPLNDGMKPLREMTDDELEHVIRQVREWREEDGNWDDQ